LLLVAIASCLDAAQERLTSGQMSEAIFIETVSTPTPGEFFLALGKQSQPNWSKLLRSTVPVATSDREQIAMQLGMLVADGFMAIEAQNGQSVKNTTRDILILAKKLNVSQQIVARGQSISDFADTAQWRELREELDAMQNDIRLSLLEQKDSPLVVLAAAGSWVRQIEMGSNILASGEKPVSTELLSQPDVASRILARVQNLPQNSKKSPLVQSLLSVLLTASALMSESKSNLPATSVSELVSTMSGFSHAVGGTDSQK
jgi:hypothetical protein